MEVNVHGLPEHQLAGIIHVKIHYLLNHKLIVMRLDQVAHIHLKIKFVISNKQHVLPILQQDLLMMINLTIAII